MVKRLAVLAVVIILHIQGFAQKDSVVFSPDYKLADGVFLNYHQLRTNTPVLKDQIISDISKDQLEFLSKIMFEEKFSFKRNDSVITMKTLHTWGYVQNNTFYVNFREDFYRIPVFGAISFLVANVTVMNPGFYDPRFGYSTGGANTREIREFLINFYDGVVTDFTMDEFENLISRDKELYDEFKKLGRRKRKDQLYKFIRRYNESHPVHFLK